MYKSNIFAFIIILSIQVLLVASQSTSDNSPIDNRSCNIDSDCVNDKSEVNDPWYNQTLTTRSGNFMCVQGKCKFVVAAGQQCREAADCAAFYYSNLHNISLDDYCNPQQCDLGSRCDGAWDQKDIPSIPKIGEQPACCVGLPDESICDIVANNVDPCNSKCVYDKETNSAKCTNEKHKQHIWIGVIICLLGSTTLNVGLNIQKYAFTRYQEVLDKQSMTEFADDNSSIKNSINLEQSSFHSKLEKFMFWKQIVISPLWVIGLGIYIFGSLLTFVALKFAPQSLVAPLGVVSLVVNLLIAPILHHQVLTKWDIIGVLLITCGSVVITVFSGNVSPDYKLCVLIELFKRTQTIVYLTIIGIFIFTVFTFIRVVERNAAQKDKEALDTFVKTFAAIEQENTKDKLNSIDKSTPVINLSQVNEDEVTQSHVNENSNVDVDRESFRLSIKFDENRKSLTEEIDQTLAAEKDEDNSGETTDNNNDEIELEDEIGPMPQNRNSVSSTKSAVRQRNIKEKVLLPLAYAILASSLATITTLFAKSLINLLSVSFAQKDNQFKDLLSWAILFITVLTAIGQIYWISMGLKKYDALLQVPIFYCNWSLFDIIGGGIYYDEFRHSGPREYAGFTIGVLIIFSGVGLLSKRLAKLTKEEEKLKEVEKKWEEMKKKKKRKRNSNRKKAVEKTE